MNIAFRTTWRVIIINKLDQFLLVKMWEVWAIPGGWIDFAESIPQAIARESLEELNIEAVYDKILFIQDYVWERKWMDTHFVEFFCVIKNNTDFSNAIEATKEASHGHELKDIWRYGIDEFPQEFLPSKLIDVLKEYLWDRDSFQTQYISDISKY